MADYTYFIEDRPGNHLLFSEINQLDLDDDNVYSDTEGSREELEQLLGTLDYQDRLIILSVVELSETARELPDVLLDLQDKGVVVQSILEPILSGEEYYTAIKEFVDMTKHYSERSRKRKYKEAQEQGRVGRPAKTKEIEHAIKMYQTRAFTIAEIEELTKISKSTLYRYLKDVDRDA